MKKASIFIYLFFFCILAPGLSYAQNWEALGPDDFNQASFGEVGYTSGDPGYSSLALDNSGLPYIAYDDATNSHKATVRRFNGSTWTAVGVPGISNADVSNIILDIDGNGTPYIAYKDYPLNNAVVKKYNGNSWVDVGATGVITGEAFSMALDASGMPYLAYITTITNKVRVRKYNGSAWVDVGLGGNASAGTTTRISLALDGSSMPYIAYQDGSNSNKVTVRKFNGSSWADVGAAGISAGTAAYISLDLDGSGMPYVAYQDATNNKKAIVKKYNGSAWAHVGTAGFTAGTANNLSLALSSSGKPYLAYLDATNRNRARVKDFNSNDWADVGTIGFSGSGVFFYSLELDGNGTPYAAYIDYANNNKATVKKYNGTSWEFVGTAGISAGEAPYLSFALDPAGTPFVAYQDPTNNNRARVKKFNGSSWVDVGSPPATVDEDLCLAIDGNGTPYIAYQDATRSKRTTVMKFNGTSWSLVGTGGFSAGRATNMSLAFDSNEMPYLAYADYANDLKTTVKKYNGTSWVTVGTGGISTGAGNHNSLAFDNYDVPYVAYQNVSVAFGLDVFVKKFNGSNWVDVGTPGFPGGTVAYISLKFNSNNTPFIAYRDDANGERATVKKFDGSSWVDIGQPGFSSGSVIYPSLAFKGNRVYLGYGNSGAFVKTYSNGKNMPTDIGLSVTAINENIAPNSTIGTLSATDPDAGNTFTYSLVSGKGSSDNSLFSLTGNTLSINNSPDFETKASYSLRLRATDQDGLYFEKTLTVTINDINEAPTNISFSAASVVENTPANSSVGNFSSTDQDASNTFSYTLVLGTGDTDNTTFSISNNALQINISPDFEAKNSYSIRVRTADQGGLSFEKAFTISVSNLNEAPTNLMLSSTSVNENIVSNATAGTLSTTDPDAGSTFTYSLVAGSGSTDNAAFNISGNALRITNSPNYEVKNSYSIRVRTTDSSGLTFEKAYTITVNDINENPSLPTDNDAAANTVAENAINGTTVGLTASATDPESQTITYSLTNSAGGRFAINATTGVVTVANGSLLDFEISTSHQITVQASDGTLSMTQNFTIAVNDLDEVAPTAIISSTASSPTASNPIPVTVTFSENVTGFTVADVIISGGTINNFSGSAMAYSFDITPAAAGTITLNIPVGAASDAAGNSNTATLPFSIIYSISTGTGADILSSGVNLQVYPNPSSSRFTIEMQNTESAEVIVMDLAGRKVMHKPMVGLNGTIKENLELKAASGTYLLFIQTKGQLLTRKLVLQ
jgi:hypothetical protein